MFGSSSNTGSSNIGTSTQNTTNSFFQSPLQPQQPQQPQVMVASLASYPFQYLQQCFDPNHINYRFRVSYSIKNDLFYFLDLLL